MGRKRDLLTDDIRELIAADVARGLPLVHAAEFHGISRMTVQNWLRRGEQDPESPAGEFRLRILQAQARFLKRHVERVDDIAMGVDEGDARASQWLLERRAPEHWGPKQTLEHTGAGGAPLLTRFANMTEEELDRALEEARAARAAEKALAASTEEPPALLPANDGEGQDA